MNIVEHSLLFTHVALLITTGRRRSSELMAKMPPILLPLLESDTPPHARSHTQKINAATMPYAHSIPTMGIPL